MNEKKQGFYAGSIDPRMIRLRKPHSQEYLHMSGQGTTKGTLWAWLGYAYQAQALAAQAEARGEVWPFEIVGRGE